MTTHQPAAAARGSFTDCPLSAQAGPFADYELGAAYDEMFGEARADCPVPRPHYEPLFHRLRQTSPEDFRRRKAMTDLSMRQDGVGFTVYRADEGIERVW
ncbi:MAG: hypothetical protein ACKOHK_10055, partial [Planctomycetia bacterium]